MHKILNKTSFLNFSYPEVTKALLLLLDEQDLTRLMITPLMEGADTHRIRISLTQLEDENLVRKIGLNYTRTGCGSWSGKHVVRLNKIESLLVRMMSELDEITADDVLKTYRTQRTHFLRAVRSLISKGMVKRNEKPSRSAGRKIAYYSLTERYSNAA